MDGPLLTYGGNRYELRDTKMEDFRPGAARGDAEQPEGAGQSAGRPALSLYPGGRGGVYRFHARGGRNQDLCLCHHCGRRGDRQRWRVSSGEYPFPDR